MKTILPIAVILFIFVFDAQIAHGAEPAHSGSDMPLELYQKMKLHFDALYGAQTSLLEPVNKSEVEKDLRADAAANKDALIAALSSATTIHREIAARALEYCGDKKAAVGALIKIVCADSDENVRRAAAAALAKLPDSAAVEPLMKGLADNADSVRGTCAVALGNIKDNRACDALLRLLSEDAKPMVRMLAATALSKIKEPATLPGLTKLLETEKDERVKMAIAGAMRALMGGNSAESAQMPTAEGTAGELSSLAKEMKDVEDKLRSDRHDQAVQVQGSSIEKKLAMLIEKLDKACNGNGSSSSEQKQQQQQQQSGSKQGNGKASSPATRSQLGSAVPQGAMNTALVTGKQDPWAKLPPAQRDELLQAFREEMPERWRKRLEAYFLSIAAEEGSKSDK